MRYIQKIYDDGGAIAIPVRQIVHVDLSITEYTKKWYVDVYYIPCRDLRRVTDFVRMCEVESRSHAFDVYINILNIIAEEN